MSNPMKAKTAYLYVLPTMADWEVGYLIAELNTGRFFRKGTAPVRVATVALTREPVTTMGGVRIVPDTTIAEVSAEGATLLILPGGDTWLKPIHAPVISLAQSFLSSGVPVAAICGATMSLANAEVLNSRKHTSNSVEILEQCCPGYQGKEHYREYATVTDGGLITAGGAASLEFAQAVLQQLNVFSPPTLQAWYEMHKTQNPECFYALIASLG